MPCPTVADALAEDPYAGFDCTCKRRHVHCDVNCGAFDQPVTPDEVLAAYKHWRGHAKFHGCSHGN